mmetsp:Transcript_43582/g.111419  ORF Transcript_43582/g.111419 Transcript_43582/m.111419 type:complete len:122 (+) Transcript_43582:214-579(+)|eukprot:jgi/Tetstr1/462330/TSEL_007336.t1
MLPFGAELLVTDNSGAKIVQNITGGKMRRGAQVGDVVTTAVKKSASGSGGVSAGTVQRALVVGTKKAISRADGSHVKFDRNTAVLVNQKGDPIGTRVLSMVTYELRKKGFARIMSMATRVI